MKAFPKLCRNLLSLLLLIIFSLKGYSQSENLYSFVHPDIDIKEYPPSKIDCKLKIDKNGYNYINNGGFRTESNVTAETNPFPPNRVNFWVETHGTPALNNFITNPLTTPAGGFANYASMYSWAKEDKTYGEGIAQVIPVLKKGEKYKMNFFKKLADPTGQFKTGMSKFLIVLTHCDQYDKIHLYPDYKIPAIPSGSQIIYSESNLKNADWQKMYNHFTSEDDYNLVWIFPVQSADVTDLLGVDFTGLVIADENAVTSVCDIPDPLPGCNLIYNSGFIRSINPGAQTGAFQNNNIQYWESANGSVDLNSHYSPGIQDWDYPFAYGDFAVMVTGFTSLSTTEDEGLAAKIRTVQQGKRYVLSFFISATSIHSFYPSAQNVTFKAVLINCPQSFPDPNNNYVTAPFTNPNQIIYCETLGVPGHFDWRQVVIGFTADHDYNMIRFFPEDAHISTGQSGIGFGHPELVEINAGPPPATTTTGNCSVTIGPPNTNCPIQNGEFAWIDPAGNLHPIAANSTDQTITVDENNPANVGTWSLQLAVPGVSLSPSLCLSALTAAPVATVYVPGCGAALWPKIYGGKGNQGLLKDNAGSIYTSVHELCLGDVPLNHFGFLPPALTPAPNYYEYNAMNYLTGSTECTWGKRDARLCFTLNDGTIQMVITDYANNTIQYHFYNAATGVLVSNPPNVGTNEIMVAEVGNATTAYITKDYNQIWVHNTNGSNYSIPTGYPIKTKFNPATNILYVWGGNQMVAYFYNGTTLLQQNPPVPFPSSYNVVGINNAGEIFVKVSGVIWRFDINTGGLSMFNIANFINSNIRLIEDNNPYTEDRVLFFNEADRDLYALGVLNSATMTERKAHVSNTGYIFSYVFDGNYVYLAGFNVSQDLTIGNHVVNWLPNLNNQNCFITKVDLTNDFGSRMLQNPVTKEIKNSLDAEITPNPVDNVLRITIKENNDGYGAGHKVYITDLSGNVLLKIEKYKSGSDIDISRLGKGACYVTVENNKREKITKLITKL